MAIKIFMYGEKWRMKIDECFEFDKKSDFDQVLKSLINRKEKHGKINKKNKYGDDF